ncbi:hypothetical protein HZS_874 [Henneguya salminicola]|nr:hypothetical protein HZS_874 [Henneguya salminicola]
MCEVFSTAKLVKNNDGGSHLVDNDSKISAVDIDENNIYLATDTGKICHYKIFEENQNEHFSIMLQKSKILTNVLFMNFNNKKNKVDFISIFSEVNMLLILISGEIFNKSNTCRLFLNW